ncbi:putative ATP-dependent RNA helicase DHR1 [Dispira parvispora]|uniref:RNA helicase n=1 Tax=Dispira parvispora TaxID=1520584 RepID=A0A9W8AT50_9FUNG|nr:putative ATP-dependent RNA helicase DHR1 [Dispira parvispora]
MGKARPRFNAKARASAANREFDRTGKVRGQNSSTTTSDSQPIVKITKAPQAVDDPNALVMPAKKGPSRAQRLSEAATAGKIELPDSKMSTQKKKRLEKYIEKKLKKDQRIELLQKLSASHFNSELMRSSRELGSGQDTMKERLRRALAEHRQGLPQSDASVRLFVERQVPDGIEGVSNSSEPPSVPDADAKHVASESITPPTGASPVFGGALKRNADGTTALPIKKRRRQKKEATYRQLLNKPLQRQMAKLTRNDSSDSSDQSSVSDDSASETESDHDVSHEVSHSSSEDEQADESHLEEKLPAHTPKTALVPPPSSVPPQSLKPETPAPPTTNDAQRKAESFPGQPAVTTAQLPAKGQCDKPTDTKRDSIQQGRPVFNVPVDRDPAIQEARMQLPICGEEQEIMETIQENLVTVLCGETGSGKTTQVPQFLYEAGFGHSDSENPGMIGITQPRRVAAVSMAKRVAEELNITQEGKVAYQIRYDTTVNPNTSIKFMTDGVLLRELAHDLLLSKYSVLIIDEAHERSLNTDILIGVVSRVVKLRDKLYRENPQENHRPLRVVIMSATLRVEDFTQNSTLFATPPPVINVEARQYPVKVHFNRRTHADYVTEAYKKACKIHTRLPPGGILIFATSQNEVTLLCRKLRDKFPGPTEKDGPRVKNSLTLVPEDDPQATQGFAANDLQAEEVDMGKETETNLENVESDLDYDTEEEEVEGEEDPDEENESPSQDNPDATVPPLHVLPLYSLLPTAHQMRVFDPVPEGHRLCVVATNVAETSLTIPGIRYVVDTGKVKDRVYDDATGVQSFEVGWVSKASAGQRAGRAGRTGPGHCYRLYSSAVFNDYFAQFGTPEILKMPIEGVVLQMKNMLLDNVVNFPFPTPPERTALRKAENLLVYLNALDHNRRSITDVGKFMALFPVAPRYSRMLVVGQKENCLPYVIAIVAALSVGDPFIHESHLVSSGTETNAPSQLDDPTAQAELDHLTNEAFAEKQRHKQVLKQHRNALETLARKDFSSDPLRLLNAVCAYEYQGGSETFCSQFFLRPKAMQEVRKLRSQLTKLVQLHCPQINVWFDPRMKPPSSLQLQILRQTVVAGFIDQLAIRWDLVHTLPPPGLRTQAGNATAAYRPGRTCRHTAYVTMWSDEPVYVHPTSILYYQSPPELLAYRELQRTMGQANNPNLALDVTLSGADKDFLKSTGRLWIKDNTVAFLSWLPVLGKTLCTFAKPAAYPLPRYYHSKDVKKLTPAQQTKLYRSGSQELSPDLSGTKDLMVAGVASTFGLKDWALPMVQVVHRRQGTRWVFDKIAG